MAGAWQGQESPLLILTVLGDLLDVGAACLDERAEVPRLGAVPVRLPVRHGGGGEGAGLAGGRGWQEGGAGRRVGLQEGGAPRGWGSERVGLVNTAPNCGETHEHTFRKIHAQKFNKKPQEKHYGNKGAYIWLPAPPIQLYTNKPHTQRATHSDIVALQLEEFHHFYCLFPFFP